MAIIGTIVVYIILACMVAGAAASIFKPQSELGGQFLEGIHSIGPIFLSVAGIFAAIPYLSVFIESVFGPLFGLVGADPSMAATTLIAVDMGSYQLAEALAQTKESWIMAMMNGYMAGATLVFTVPIGLSMIEKRHERVFALGIMSGILTVPVGVLVSSGFTALTNPMIRETVSTNAEASYQLAMSWGLIFRNLIPLVIICVLIAAGLLLIPNGMIKGFKVFAKFIEVAARVVLVLCILEYFTGVFSSTIGWGFDPIIATAEHPEAALEVAGYVSLMLAGAFPMVWLIQRYLNKPLGSLGKAVGLSGAATSGILASCANVLALFPMMKDMRDEDAVQALAFSVCGAFLIGDHLSFMANFQPTLIVPLLLGKLVAAALAVFLAKKIAVPRLRLS